MDVRVCLMGKRTTPVTKRNRGTFGDHNFKGTGKLRCYICNRPIRDHPVIGPCPFPQTKTPRTPSTRGTKATR